MVVTTDEVTTVNMENSTVTPNGDGELENTIRLFSSNKFNALSKVILRDLNKNSSSPTFYKYTKEKIARFLENPAANEKNLRDAVIYIYSASSHFRRLIQYFTVLSDLSYVVSPTGIDTSNMSAASVKKTYKNYRQVIELLTKMDIKNQFPKILTVCLREDVFYATLWVTSDSIIVQQLPSDYCKIAIIEDNVPNVSFDFSYFDANSQYLDIYPDEFKKKYAIYQKDRMGNRWQELDSPTSFAVKCNNDILNYAVPPFAGILREIYDIEDYKTLKLTKTELENYAMLVMNLEINDDGEWKLDYNKAKGFWENLDSVLPEEVGSILTPMPIDKISFEKSNTGDTNTIADAEENLFTAAGVSQLLFNSEKSSANALLLSIKVDQSVTYGIVKSIECAINRFIHHQSFGKNFKMTFLDCSPFNRKELGDEYLKACQYGLPMISYFAASQGMSQEEVDCMTFLESDVLNYTNRFKPLKSSATLSAKDAQKDAEKEVSLPGEKTGRPLKEGTDLTEPGEQTREDA